MKRLIIAGVCFTAVLFFTSVLCPGQRGLTRPSMDKILLSEPQMEGQMSLEQSLARRRSVREFAAGKLDFDKIGQLAWAGQGITDKAKGFRTSPSAGAIYPMTLYFATQEGLFVYDPAEHTLQQLTHTDVRSRLAAAAMRQDVVARAPCDIIIAGSVRKVSAKYGGKARRYALLEAGHIAQNILLQAAAMELAAVPIGAFDIRAVARTCRLGKELEPFYIICAGYPLRYAGKNESEQKGKLFAAGQLKGKKAVLIIASRNFRDEEFFETKTVLEDAGVETITASTKKGVRTGMLGGKAEADILISQLNVDDYDAVIFIGGIGATEYFGNATALRIAYQGVAGEKIVAAICVAPTILANAGVLQGVRVTGYSSERGRLIRAGARYTGAAVERDGLIITGSGPGAARLFGREIVEALKQQPALDAR